MHQASPGTGQARGNREEVSTILFDPLLLIEFCEIRTGERSVMGLALKMILTSETSTHLTNLILEMYKQRCLLSWELASEMCPTFPW